MTEHRRPVIWSSNARSDLASIWDHYFQVAGAGTADKMVLGLDEACRLLEAHPFAGRARDGIRPGLRSTVANSYVIFYRVKHDVAEIVRVLDGRRDIDEIFGGGD